MAKPTFYSHRSGIETMWDCPRKGYFEYLHAGTGFVQHPRPPYLDVGTAVHQGFDGLINGYDPEMVIEAALRWFKEDSGQDKVLNEQRMYEHCATIEGGLWAFALYSMPRFLLEFEVLGTEVEVTDQSVFSHLTIEHMSRPDAIVYTKMPDFITGKHQHAVISWKTIDDLTDFRLNFYRRDLQTLMEAFYASKWLSSQGGMNIGVTADGESYCNAVGDIDFTQTIFLQKGKFIDEKGLFDVDAVSAGENAPKFLNSMLCYQWVKKNKSKPGPDISYAYRYKKPENAGFSALGANYERVRVGNVKQWIKQLAARQVFPACDYPDEPDPLGKIIIWDQPQPYDKVLAEQMIIQVEFEEKERFNRYLDFRELSGGKTEDILRGMLDVSFPRHVNACHVPFRCHYDGASGPCFGAQALAVDTIPEGFVKRVPHHPAELDAFQHPQAIPTMQEVGEEIQERVLGFAKLLEKKEKQEMSAPTHVQAMVDVVNEASKMSQTILDAASFATHPPVSPAQAIKALIAERDAAMARVSEINKELQAMANDLQSLLPVAEKQKRKRGPNKPKAEKVAKAAKE